MVRHQTKKKKSKTLVKEKHVGGPFQPGNQVALGNGEAKKKNRILTQALISELHVMTNSKEFNGTQEKFRVIVKKLVQRAMEGDNEATKMVFDRVDGKQFNLPGLGDGDLDGPLHVTLRIGHVAADGSKTVVETDYDRAA
jgi:hypothetical protein